MSSIITYTAPCCTLLTLLLFLLVGVYEHDRLWERLGFTKAGLIPRAGRLRRPDGNGEHYVDAHVFYKSFVEDSEY